MDTYNWVSGQGIFIGSGILSGSGDDIGDVDSYGALYLNEK
jgi:hypothetical protein